MIQKLAEHVVELLRVTLSGETTEPAAHILADRGPAPDPGALPVVRVFPGELVIHQEAKESASSQPRPQELQQEIPVDGANPGGPYRLLQTPLEGSMRCVAIHDRGLRTERRMPVFAGSGFAVDCRNRAISFLVDLTGAEAIALRYSIVGVFVVREFRQELLLDFIHEEAASREVWMSLAASAILTHHDELLEQYNVTDKTEYVVEGLVSSHGINRIDMAAAKPDMVGTIPTMRLVFNVHGQLRSTKTITGGFGIMEKIHSPGRVSDYPVDVEPLLE